jgi:hypothetical protein
MKRTSKWIPAIFLPLFERQEINVGQKPAGGRVFWWVDRGEYNWRMGADTDDGGKGYLTYEQKEALALAMIKEEKVHINLEQALGAAFAGAMMGLGIAEEWILPKILFLSSGLIAGIGQGQKAYIEQEIRRINMAAAKFTKPKETVKNR